MKKIIVWIRNLTKDIDMALNLPMEKQKLDEVINHNDEYIIIDCDILGVDEYENIYKLNDFLLECEENGISLDDLEILSEIMYYNEVSEAVKNRTYTIINFDAETADWCFGHGGDLISDFDKGMCLFDSGHYNPFKFKMTDAIHCWIDWEAVWRNATTEGWQEVEVNGTGYLVHR
jgi:hypothetical protein